MQRRKQGPRTCTSRRRSNSRSRCVYTCVMRNYHEGSIFACIYVVQAVRGRAGLRQRHAFFGQWLEKNLNRILPARGVTLRTELRSTGHGPSVRADAVLFVKEAEAVTRYVILELDDNEHKRIGLANDVFKTNRLINSRWPGKKTDVVRLNPDEYELGDGQVVHTPKLRERLARLATVLQRLLASEDADASFVRITYLYYSPDRLQAFRHRAGCTLHVHEADVEYVVKYHPHADPGYVAPA